MAQKLFESSGLGSIYTFRDSDGGWIIDPKKTDNKLWREWINLTYERSGCKNDEKLKTRCLTPVRIKADIVDQKKKMLKLTKIDPIDEDDIKIVNNRAEIERIRILVHDSAVDKFGINRITNGMVMTPVGVPETLLAEGMHRFERYRQMDSKSLYLETSREYVPLYLHDPADGLSYQLSRSVEAKKLNTFDCPELNRILKKIYVSPSDEDGNWGTLYEVKNTSS